MKIVCPNCGCDDMHYMGYINDLMQYKCARCRSYLATGRRSDEMTWFEFKQFVDTELYNKNISQHLPVNYIDIIFPDEDNVPQISLDGDSISIT